MTKPKNYRFTVATPKGNTIKKDDHAISVLVDAYIPSTGITRLGALRMLWEELFWEPVKGERIILWKGERKLPPRTL